MTTQRQMLLALLGIVVGASAIGEHQSRRMMERRYQQAVQTRQQLERQFSSVLATHQKLMSDLASERQRAQALSDAVAAKSAELERAVGRLANETQTIRELQLRLRAQEQHMAQLQGEMASVLRSSQSTAGAFAPDAAVELERIMVSHTGSPALQGRVISVHSDWDFVVIDLGWDDVRIGDTVSILRNDAFLAKAKVERVQEGISAAAILPEWDAAEIQVNDRVQLL